jgi:hypothetical protein
VETDIEYRYTEGKSVFSGVGEPNFGARFTEPKIRIAAPDSFTRYLEF